jgi:DNA-binding PadR family transcriptional regulator
VNKRLLNQKAIDNTIKRRFSQKIISSFLEIIILRYFENKIFSGYDVIVFIHKKFGILLSAGKVYSTLYVMERSKLINGFNLNKRKKVYRLTEKGEYTLTVLVVKKKELNNIIFLIF